MAYFEVNVAGLTQMPAILEEIGEKLLDLDRQLLSCMENLSDYFSETIRVGSRLEENVGYLHKTAGRVNQFSESLGLICGRYAYYEGQAADAMQSSAAGGEDAGNADSRFKRMADGWMEEDKETSAIKTILKRADSWGGYKEAGILESADSYIRDAYSFFTGDKKGMTGAGGWCQLADSSIGLWTGAYDYYADQYDVTKGFFGKQAQKNVLGLELGGSILGLGSSIFSASDGLGEKSVPGMIADYVDCGKDGVSVYKAGYKLKHVDDVKSLVSKSEKAGLWSGLDVYAAVAEAGIGTVAQGFRSYEKYSADGKWDAGDTSDTAIDMSMAGIYGLGHSLSGGLDDLVYGAIDHATGGSGNSDMSYMEKAAEGWKIIAEECADGWVSLIRGAGTKIKGLWGN